MKKNITIVGLSLLIVTSSATSQVPDRAPNADKTATKKAVPESVKSQMSKALSLVSSGMYENAASALFNLSRRPELESERPQIKYLLGNMLVELKMYQTAAFQYVEVIASKNSKYLKPAITKLSEVADYLGDDTLLNYAISKLDVSDFPASEKDMIYFRLGENQMRSGNPEAAIGFFTKVNPKSSYYNQAIFSQGLAELELKKPDSAISTLKKISDSRILAKVNDNNKVAAQLGIARALYQKQDWDAAVEGYSQVPRDSQFWHEAVFEQSWAMLRGARFRSAISNFQTLHSTFYDEFYIPESLILRSIVYLYICKYDEMEKVLSLFDRTYNPILSSMNRVNSTLGADPLNYYAELEMVNSPTQRVNAKLPPLLVRHMFEQGNVKRSLRYIDRLGIEKRRLESTSFRGTPLGQYSIKLLANRQKNTKIAIGEMMKNHIVRLKNELRDLTEQASFVRYELTTGKKETLKRQLTESDVSENKVNKNIDRSFYVQNGYEYYPFQGEFWLDELGNYHYLGQQSCEENP